MTLTIGNTMLLYFWDSHMIGKFEISTVIHLVVLINALHKSIFLYSFTDEQLVSSGDLCSFFWANLLKNQESDWKDKVYESKNDRINLNISIWLVCLLILE